MTEEVWLQRYRQNKEAIWIKVQLSDGTYHYYDEFYGWLTIKELCKSRKVFPVAFALQHRSHRVDIDLSDCDGFYFIRSIKGQAGGTSKNFYITGTLKNGIVHKTMWSIPELTIEEEYDDNVANCFEEAMIYHEKASAV